MAKQQISITLQVKELLFDIAQKTHLVGLSRLAEGKTNYEAASRMQASDDDEIAYQIKRSINDNFAALKTIMAEYLDETATTADNLIKTIIDNKGKLELTFSLPSNYNTAATSGLSAGIHDYLVYKAISEWFTISNKADAQDYLTLATDALSTAQTSLYKRTRPTYDSE